jgi:hypothetical protein
VVTDPSLFSFQDQPAAEVANGDEAAAAGQEEVEAPGEVVEGHPVEHRAEEEP